MSFRGGYSQPPTRAANHQPTYAQPQYHQAQSAYIEGSDMADNRPPRLSATFYPGHEDDFFVPEIISPSPQRIMPEVPSNMQQELAHLELEARNPPAHRMSVTSMSSEYGATPITPLQPHQLNARGMGGQQQKGPGFTASYQHTNASAYQNINREYQQSGGVRPQPESPKFSPFPKLRDAGPNVPLSDEDKEEVLERARPQVLKSQDPEMQLAWAQDALAWVDIASGYAQRVAVDGQPPRSITPKIEHALRVDAINIVTFLADQHHPKAEFMKSRWLEFGKFGYRMDKKGSYEGYKRAAEKGYARAEYRIGMQFEDSGDHPNAIDHYEKGVEMGDSAAHYRLGMMILLGQCGMRQDYQHGVDLIRFSADTADEDAPQGAYIYGMLLARELPNVNVPEQFLPFDLNDAKLFIEKAAYLGFAKAQLKMAQAYELCQLGCEFEPALSLHYNALAARQGQMEADMAISKWFLCGYEGVFEKNEELAFTYANRAALAKMPTAEFAMGYFYEIGMYVPVDLQESAAWYQKASDHGNKDALGRIDSIRKNNTLSKSDHEQVALSRIKSQYGSQRGQRPDRFKQRPNAMPVIQDDSLDMPDPRNSYDGVGNPRPAPAVRPVSVAPYPEDDPPRPGQLNGGPGLRPNSHMAPAADRPGSAFGIRPLHHSNTGSEHGGPRPTEPLRPSTSMGNMHVPAGRGHNPAGRDRIVSSGWEPQVPGKYRDPLSPNQQQGFLPPVDMGQPLNFDQNGPNRLQKVAPLNVNKPQPPQPPYGVDPRARPDPAVARRDPQANNVSRPPRGSSMVMNPSQPMMSPQHQQQRMSHQPMQGPPVQSPTIQSPIQSQSRQSQRPPQGTMSSQQGPNSRPLSAAPSVASNKPPSVAPSTASSGPPKKQGPSTFDEMGIPQAKNENDCIVM